MSTAAFTRFMASAARRLLYAAARASRFNAVLLNSKWRRQKLLVLCYHGISLDDEHEWSGLYVPPKLLRERFQSIREAQCNVLPLGPALEMLYAGALPPRAVVITFDDGFYDFYAIAQPLLRQFGWLATVYFTTYYSYFNAPVFDPMLSYLLWKGRTKLLSWPEVGLPNAALNDEGRRAVQRIIKTLCKEKHYSGQQKDRLLHCLAERLDLNLDDINARRILHLMTPDEAREPVGARGRFSAALPSPSRLQITGTFFG